MRELLGNKYFFTDIPSDSEFKKSRKTELIRTPKGIKLRDLNPGRITNIINRAKTPDLNPTSRPWKSFIFLKQRPCDMFMGTLLNHLNYDLDSESKYRAVSQRRKFI